MKREMSLHLGLDPPCRTCLCLGTISPLLRWGVETHRGFVARKQPPICEQRGGAVRQPQGEGPKPPAAGFPARPGS